MSDNALQIWKEKLAHLERDDAINASPARKFELAKLMAEAKTKIAQLESRAAAPQGDDADQHGDGEDADSHGAQPPKKKPPGDTIEELLILIQAENLKIEVRHILKVLGRLHLKTWLVLGAGIAAIFSAGYGLQLSIKAFEGPSQGSAVQRQAISTLLVANVERPEDTKYLTGELGRLVVRDLEQGADNGDAVLFVSCQPLPHAATPFTAEITTVSKFEMVGYAFLYAESAPKELVPRQAKPLTAGTGLTKLQFAVDRGTKDDVLIFLVRLKPTADSTIPQQPQDLIDFFKIKVMP